MSANTKKTQKGKRPPFYEEFASKIIERLQEGTAPWQVPWTLGKSSLVPHNPVSGTVYRGMNRVHLALSGYEDVYKRQEQHRSERERRGQGGKHGRG